MVYYYVWKGTVKAGLADIDFLRKIDPVCINGGWFCGRYEKQ